MSTEKTIKFDDADWHSGDAANEVQAGMHIALVYHWLLRRGFINEEYAPDNIEKLQEQGMSPGEIFIEWPDGKLLSEDMTSEAAAFLSSYYEKTYFSVIQDKRMPNLQYDARYAHPYDIRDTWSNVDVAAEFLDKAYSKWQNPRRKFWMR